MTAVPANRLGRHGFVIGGLGLGKMNPGWHMP